MSEEIILFKGEIPASQLYEACSLPSQKAIWTNADLHGWHNPACDLPTDLLLIHSEVSEACEALRKGNMQDVEEELADVIIRVLHVAEKNNFDMEKAVWTKHRANVNRPYRHGNKKF